MSLSVGWGISWLPSNTQSQRKRKEGYKVIALEK